MLGDREATINTYNISAREFSEHFRGIGPRIRDIETAFQLAGNPSDPNVLEIGCGDGRDALEIIKHTTRYIGFDASEGMLALAHQNVPGIRFDIGDATEYQYPTDIDIVFAFASLLHLNCDETHQVFRSIAHSLNDGGIFYISLKNAPEYVELVQEDEFGKRLFYLYNQGLIEELAGDSFQTVYAENSVRGKTEWLEIALQKVKSRNNQ